MARSVGAAAAEGIQSGVGLGLRLRDQQIQEQQLERTNANQDEDRAIVKADRARKLDRESDDDALKALDAQHQSLLAEGEGLSAQYGANVPPEIGGDFARRKNEVFGARDSLLRKRYQPIIDKRQQSMKDLVSRLQVGQVNVDQVPDMDLYHAFVTATRRDPKDLLPADGQPSRVSKAVTDLMTGIQTDNEGMTLAAANVIAEPELKEGIGQPSPHGGTIVGKEIIKLVPHPQNPGEFLPVLRVYVKKGDAKSDKPGGATSYYDAPVTENRSSDPNDPIQSISVQKAMDYAAQLQTLSTTLGRPDLRKKIERGQAEAAKDPEDFLSAFYALKGKAPTSDVEFKTVPKGGLLVGINKRTGKEVSRVEGPDAPATGLAGNVDAVQAYADENGMSFDEAAQLFQKRGLTRAPAKGAASGGGLKASGGTVDPNELADEDYAFMAKQYLQGDQSVFTNLGRGAQGAKNVTRLRKEVRKQAESAGMSPADTAAAVARFQGDKAAFRTAGTKGANIEMAVAEASELADLALDASKKFERTKFAPVNKALRAYETNSGDPDVVAFGAANLALINTYARAISPSGVPTVNDKQHAEAMLNTAQSADQYAAVVAQMKREMAAAQKSPGKVRDNLSRRISGGGAEASAPAAAGGASPPVTALTEGQVTTFRNGQRWTLQGGKPVQVQ